MKNLIKKEWIQEEGYLNFKWENSEGIQQISLTKTSPNCSDRGNYRVYYEGGSILNRYITLDNYFFSEHYARYEIEKWSNAIDLTQNWGWDDVAIERYALQSIITDKCAINNWNIFIRNIDKNVIQFYSLDVNVFPWAKDILVVDAADLFPRLYLDAEICFSEREEWMKTRNLKNG